MKNEMPSEEFPFEIGSATEQDLLFILDLQQKNLGRNMDEKKKNSQGFVSLETSLKLLKEILAQDNVIIARDEKKVIGYLIILTLEQGKKIHLLNPFIEQFKTVQFEDKPLNEYNHCILGQICIDENYRGKKILEALYQELKKRSANKYDIGISEIGANNPRSLRAHLNKIGLKIVGQYADDGMNWYIVILDFRPCQIKN